MTLETLDRTSWSFLDALAHVERVVQIHRAQAWRIAFLGTTSTTLTDEEWASLPSQVVGARRAAQEEFLIALREGYLRATGRLSRTPVHLTQATREHQWRLHAIDPTLITTTEWREGEINFARPALVGSEWEYTEITIPAFMVRAIWPDAGERPAPSGQAAAEVRYTTPYLDLMQAAVTRFGLTPERQGKKESLVDWFREQDVEGEPVSHKLADAMATLIRLPSAQRGGAKRIRGPDLRRTG